MLHCESKETNGERETSVNLVQKKVRLASEVKEWFYWKFCCTRTCITEVDGMAMSEKEKSIRYIE